MNSQSDTRAVLERVGPSSGVDVSSIDVIRIGENHLYRLPGGVVARVSPHGKERAQKEVAVAQWLEHHEIDAVRLCPEIAQPVYEAQTAITFWLELPSHSEGEPEDVAKIVRQIHSLPPPDTYELPPLEPFVRLRDRLDAAHVISSRDKDWLGGQLEYLQGQYDTLPGGQDHSVIHGDAWRGNIARTGDGRIVILDFERCSFGPPEWDLVSTAVSHVTTDWLGKEQWRRYCEAYGRDVTAWEGFPILRDIRELRMTLMACQVAGDNPDKYLAQAKHRIACLQGSRGQRPWADWEAVP